MRFLRRTVQHCRVCPHFARKLAFFIVAYVAGWRADQTRDVVLPRPLRHVERMSASSPPNRNSASAPSGSIPCPRCVEQTETPSGRFAFKRRHAPCELLRFTSRSWSCPHHAPLQHAFQDQQALCLIGAIFAHVYRGNLRRRVRLVRTEIVRLSLSRGVRSVRSSFPARLIDEVQRFVRQPMIRR